MRGAVADERHCKRAHAPEGIGSNQALPAPKTNRFVKLIVEQSAIVVPFAIELALLGMGYEVSEVALVDRAVLFVERRIVCSNALVRRRESFELRPASRIFEGLSSAEESLQKLGAVVAAQVADRGGEDPHADGAHDAHPTRNRPFVATALGVAGWLDTVQEIQHFEIRHEVVVALDALNPAGGEHGDAPQHEGEDEGGCRLWKRPIPGDELHDGPHASAAIMSSRKASIA